MATIADRIKALEVRVNGLETWAGPGQASVLAAGLQAVRRDLTALRRTQTDMVRTLGEHTVELATMRSTLGEHTVELATMRSTLGEHTVGLATMRSTLGEHTQELAAMRSTLGEHTQELAAMRSTLDEHTVELGAVRGTLEEHTRALARVTADVETLKADVGEVKETLREVLRRLPPPALAS
jgi:chromosome segregation ATPase